MKIKKAFLLTLVLSAMTVLLPIYISCTGASMQDIQGILQAVDGKEVIVTLSDGTTARITVQDAKLASQAGELVGTQVNIRARSDSRELTEVRSIGENVHLTGIIESITPDAVVIGGQTLKVTPNTMLDGGLVPGVLARSEFVKAADGSLLAIEIETDHEDVKLTGAISSINANTVVINGKTFNISEMTRLESGLMPGVQAKVEFVTMPDGSKVAIEIERELGDDRLTGKVEAIRPDGLKIGGKSFTTNVATRFEKGLSEGAEAHVRFVQLANGSLLATKVEVEKRGREMELEQQLRGREQEIRGREQELRGREQELRGREMELERHEQELRGREAELRGREAEGEAPRGQDNNGGLRGDGSKDDNLPRHSGLDDGGLRGDGSVDDNLPSHSGVDNGGGGGGSGGGSGGSGSSGSGSGGGNP
ncbi:MAG: hypothetical protein HYX79_01600 [Chloroflexi bacterium]|nr:hypothetical protein [Chloroflexota bacterium]